MAIVHDRIDLRKEAPLENCDWEGNNAAFTCPPCGKVYIVSGMMHRGGVRKCPSCGHSTANLSGGKESGGSAWIEWKHDDEKAKGSIKT
jgi:predicted RNA-binding Zn-ribbon protein involved in translation (DUF1610 family)